MGSATPSLYFLMAVHCHQPVGNFGHVFEQAFQRSYQPFLTVLERHPQVRLSLHYSGSLIDWLTEHQPEFLHRLRRLVQRGQIECLAAGYYEPILPLIPESDRQGQLARMQAALQELFGATAVGAWLTERVWEPELPASLGRAGIRYTILDTNQFQGVRALVPATLQIQDEVGWDLFGCYVTEYAGSSITVFPASKRLRYWIPFQPVPQTIEFFKRLARPQPVAISFADDGEKFGLWPKTYGWVYDEGWLEQFFSALEREASWLKTTTYSDYLQAVGPSGRVYLPCGSYEEMLEWSGGYFRNFFMKYPEANAMQQKMLTVSRRLEQASRHRGPFADARLLEQAQQELYKGQCNCAYWHGVFGGLYLAHLRRAVWHHLLAAEQLTAKAIKRLIVAESQDVDGDARPEVVIRTQALSAVVDPDENGAVTELCHLATSTNMIDTLARRYELYHEHLRTRHFASVGAQGQPPTSIHELLKAKEEGLETYLAYDDHRRSCFLDYALSAMPTLQDVWRSTWGEHRLWSAGRWQLESPVEASTADSTQLCLARTLQGGRLHKLISFSRREPRISFRYAVNDLTIPIVGLEWNLSLQDEKFRVPQWQESLSAFQIRDPHLKLALTMTIDPAATIASFPVETISESEGGLERTTQGLALVCLWPTAGLRNWSCTVQWAIESC